MSQATTRIYPLRTRPVRLCRILAPGLILWLAACGGPTTRVIDTPETRELKGWQKPYEVDGRRYHPLRHHHGFQERGVASWYGRKFHGRKTSNGETYDMYGLSAAHKTLPLGVYVKVTRLDDGRQIVVRVNDRGPFVAGRVIDLSYGAARKLGLVEEGTTPVQVVALGYRREQQGRVTYQEPSSYDAGRFSIQVGAFADSANAYRLAQQMRPRYGSATVVAAVVNGKTLHRVRIGDFRSLKEAEQTAIELTAHGFSGSFVVAFER